MGLREIESTLPPGFRFYPSDEELVCHYLYKKVANERAARGTLVEVDLHAREPWELPDAAKLTASEWYFFNFRDRKYATGSRRNRATKTGYWKATGKDREVRGRATRAVVGMRKTLVFYQGRAPNGVKSCWVMHEFRIHSPHTPPKEDWVLCRVFQKGKDGDHDNAGSSIAGSSQAVALPDLPGTMDAYTDYLQTAGSSAGFAPPHEDDPSLLMNAAIWQYGSLLLDQYLPQEASSSPMPMMGLAAGSRPGGGDGCGAFFSDTAGFEDTAANLAGVGFPQGWMG